MSLSEILLTYPANPYEYYAKFIDLPGFVLLQSSDTSRGRYDILSAYPYKILTNPNTILSDLESSLSLQSSQSTLPFQGGAIGFFSYDFACGQFNIPLGLSTNSAFPLAQWGLYDWAIIVDHLERKTLLIAANKVLETQHIISEIKKRWFSQPIHTAFNLKKPFVPLIEKQSYLSAFDKVQEALHAGRCYQVNLTQPFKASYQGNLWALYEKVNRSNPTAFAAFIPSDQGSILSFSPERFVRLAEGTLLTSPIKGTIKKSNDPVIDQQLQQTLQSSVKDRAENIMIVDLLRNDLGKIAQSGSVKVKALCAIESYQNLHHLVSHIEAVCSAHITPVQAFISCFPGGSITGAPKLESMKVIAEIEPYARGIYCGSLGYFSHHGRFETNIAIRTLMATNQDLYLSAGGAIVIDSKAEEEYAECLTKINSVIGALS